MRRPQQSRSETSAERMLDAAHALLAEGGLAAVTVAGVAARAGTSNGSLYHRFGDRAGLLLALHDRAFEVVLAETAEAFAEADRGQDRDQGRDGDLGTAVRDLAGAALRIFGRHRGVMRAFLVELADDAALEARNAAVTARIREVVTGWLRERAGASPADADDAFALLYALGVTEALVGSAAISPDAVARAVLAISRR